MMNNRELIYILPDSLGGVANVVANLLKYSNNNQKTKVILLRNKDSNSNINFQFKCTEQIIISYSSKNSPHYIFSKINKHISDNAIVISNDGAFDIKAVVKSRRNLSIIYIMHGDFKHYFNVLSKYHSYIDKVICVSSYLAEKVHKLFPSLNVECVFFPVPSYQQDTNLEYRCVSEEINIVYVGALTERKGVELFPDFINMLNERDINYKFRIIGSGELSDSLHILYREDQRVCLLGQQHSENVIKYLDKSNILILMSKGEGLPVCIVEAMKMGVVPIVFNLPSGIPEIINDGENGYIIEQGDITSCVNYIEMLHSNRQLLLSMAKNAKEFAISQFSPFEQVRKYENRYNSIAPKPRLYKSTLGEWFCERIPSKLLYFIKSNIKRLQK